MVKQKRRNLSLPNVRGRWTDTAHYIAIAMLAKGSTEAEIAQELHTTPLTVKRNLAQPLPSQRPCLHTPPQKCKREQALRHSILKHIVREMVDKVGGQGRVVRVRKYPHAAALGAECVRRGAKPVSKRQINLDVQALGFSARRKPKGPRRYPQDEALRVKFAKDRLHEAKDQRLEWIFSDEKKATVQDGQVIFEYVQNGEAPSRRVMEQAPPCVHLWGAISNKWRKLIIFSDNSGTMNQQVYIEDIITPLKGHLQGSQRRFVQDGAKAHTSYYALGSLSVLEISLIDDWPARSPDLNPIENIWSLLMRRVQTHHPTTKEDLRRWIPVEFNKITKAEIQRCVQSFPQRLEEVIRVKGKTITTKLRKKRG